jgi:hypothetical protein
MRLSTFTNWAAAASTAAATRTGPAVQHQSKIVNLDASVHGKVMLYPEDIENPARGGALA